MDPYLVIEALGQKRLSDDLNEAFEKGYRVIQFTTIIEDKSGYYTVIMQHKDSVLE